MNKYLSPALFITLAALFSGAWTHYSLALVAGTAVLAAVMYFCRVLPLRDGSPTLLQKALGLILIIAMCIGFVLETKYYWAYWFMQAFCATFSSYLGVTFLDKCQVFIQIKCQVRSVFLRWSDHSTMHDIVCDTMAFTFFCD